MIMHQMRLMYRMKSCVRNFTRTMSRPASCAVTVVPGRNMFRQVGKPNLGVFDRRFRVALTAELDSLPVVSLLPHLDVLETLYKRDITILFDVANFPDFG